MSRKAGRRQTARQVVAGVGMRSSELLAASGKTTRGGCGLGCGEGELGLGPKVGGLLSFFQFFV